MLIARHPPKAGIFVALGITILMVAILSALLIASPLMDVGLLWDDPYYRHISVFSFYQALLSTLLSVLLAIPVALALSRRQFIGRTWLCKVFSMTLVLPTLVGVFGILAIYGYQGVLSQLCQLMGIECTFSLYGLQGIVLAHVFFNLPYASRIFLQTLESIPTEQHKLCAHLGMNHWQKFKWTQWPPLAQQLPHTFGIVFILCFTSFAIVMALGGGPKATTIELAIYQAIKFDFDLQTGALLALWQMLLCCTLALTLQKWAKPLALTPSLLPSQSIPYQDSLALKIADYGAIGFAAALVLPPLLSVLLSGFNNHMFTVLSSSQFWTACGYSITIALLSSSIAMVLGVLILITSRTWRLQNAPSSADKIEMLGCIALVVPSIVMSCGLFLLLRDIANISHFAPLLVGLINGLMALPYVIKIVSHPMLQTAQQYELLCQSLGMQGWQRFKLVEWRLLSRPLAHAAGISFMISMGDLGAIALFGSDSLQTLPLYLYQLLGSYQMQAAAVISTVLLLLSMASFLLFESLFQPNSRDTQC